MCDGINRVHNNIVINEEPDGIRVICQECKEINIIRIGYDGRMDNKHYSKIFKRDILQPGENLYYKVHPERMSLI